MGASVLQFVQYLWIIHIILEPQNFPSVLQLQLAIIRISQSCKHYIFKYQDFIRIPGDFYVFKRRLYTMNMNNKIFWK